MMVLLCVIEHTFAIKDRGVVAIGNRTNSDLVRYRVGDPVQIRRQDGSVVASEISGIPIQTLREGEIDLLFGGLSGSDIGMGDEVWIRNN
jgi:hypothetical protein